MKKLNITILLTLLVLMFSCNSEPRESVFDYEEILTEDQEQKLTTLFSEHLERTSNDIALITTRDWEDQSGPKDFAEYFVSENRSGTDILIVFSKENSTSLISTSSEMRKILTDDKGKELSEIYMFPKFIEEKYFEGLYDGSEAIVKFLEEVED